MFNSKSWLMFWLFLATGAIVGGLLGDALVASNALGSGTAFFVQKYTVLAIPPAVIDLYVMRITVGFEFQPNLVAILGMVIAIFLFKRI